MMLHDELLIHLRRSAAIKLLQSQNAPLVFSFFIDQFKNKHRLTIPHTELLNNLTVYLETLQESDPSLYPGPAVAYLRQWCDEEHRFLRRYYEGDRDEPVYELTPDSERAIGWVEGLEKSSFVGTESRFLHIFQLLQQIVTYSNEDVPARLAQLEREKEGIQTQIDQIVATGKVEQFTQTQIKERFFEADDVARRLIADFREVEENFRVLVRQVQEKHLTGGARKGQIVQHVLEADAALKESDQGRSFYAFWEFLISARQGELQTLLGQVFGVPEVQALEAAQGSGLRRLARNLLAAAAKITESNQRLSEQLRKLLNEQAVAESRRVMEIIHEIKQQLVRLPPLPDELILLNVETTPRLEMPLERPLWSAPVVTNYSDMVPTVAEPELGEGVMEAIWQQFYVDTQLRQRYVAALLEDSPEVTLKQVVDAYPLSQGLAELVTYVAMAAQEAQHQIDSQQGEEISLDEAGSLIRAPLVTFKREQAND